MGIFLLRVVPANISLTQEHLHFNLTFFPPQPDSWVGFTVLGDANPSFLHTARSQRVGGQAGDSTPWGTAFLKKLLLTTQRKVGVPILIQHLSKTIGKHF